MLPGKSLVTYNIHLRYVKSMEALHERINALKPTRVMLLVDKDEHLIYVREFQNRHPTTEVCVRVVDTVDGGQPRDGAWHTKPKSPGDLREYICSPEDFLNRWGEFGKNGLILNVLNEPSGEEPPDVIDRLVRWTLAVLKLATERDIRVGVLNFATGHPHLYYRGDVKRWEWDAHFDPILVYLSKNKQHELWLHEYLPSKGENSRVGRVRSMVNRCKSLGIEIPFVSITEFGWDNDIISGDGRSGYKSRGITGDSYAKDVCKAASEEYAELLNMGKLCMVAVFSYGRSSSDWESFDVETDNTFHQTLQKLAPRTTAITTIPVVAPPTPPVIVPVTPVPPPVTKPDPDQFVEIKLRVKKSDLPGLNFVLDLLKQISVEVA